MVLLKYKRNRHEQPDSRQTVTDTRLDGYDEVVRVKSPPACYNGCEEAYDNDYRDNE